MKLPAYAKQLIAQREAGRDPWLVIVSIGRLRDSATLAGEQGIARIGWEVAATVHEAHWRVLVGLDVLVSFWGDISPSTIASPHMRAWREQQAMAHALGVLWQAGEPGTMWVVDGQEARDVEPWCTPVSHEWVAGCGAYRYALNPGLRGQILTKRRLALLTETGVFARPEFNAVRASVWADVAALCSHAPG